MPTTKCLSIVIEGGLIVSVSDTVGGLFQRAKGTRASSLHEASLALCFKFEDVIFFFEASNCNRQLLRRSSNCRGRVVIEGGAASAWHET